MFSITSCKLYTNVSYKMTTVYPCRDFDHYEFRYKNSVFLVKDSANKYVFGDSLRITR